jgi:hypothetical protein
MCRDEARNIDRECASEHRVKLLRAELANLDRDITRARSRLARVDDETFEVLNADIAKWAARRQAVEVELAEVGMPSHGRRLDEFIGRLEQLVGELRTTIHKQDRHRVRALLREVLAWVEVRVERRLVGKKKPRYYLTGGDIMLRAGVGETPISDMKGRWSQGARVPDDVRLVSTEVLGNEGAKGAAGASVSLSRSEPRACPR